MFSRNRGAKPTGKRPPSSQEDRMRMAGEMSASSRHEPPNRHEPPRMLHPPEPPLALPRIPRVASQYGAYGPAAMSELERKLMSFALQEEEEDDTHHPSKGKSRLETIQDTQAQLTGTTQRLEPPREPVRQSSPPRPRTASSNFSRPIQVPRRPSDADHSRSNSNEQIPTRMKSSAKASWNVPIPIQQWPQNSHPQDPPEVDRTTSLPRTRIQFSAFPTIKPQPPALQPPPLARPLPPAPSHSTTSLQRPKTAPEDRLPQAQPTEIGFENGTVDNRPASRDRLGSRDGGLPLRQAQDGALMTRPPPPRFDSVPELPLSNVPPPPPPPKRISEDSAPITIASATTLGPAKPSKSVKSRFNPISLITRRKTGQTTRPAPTETFPPPLPADYDPRIRGHVVHDFSAPRFQQGGSMHAPGSLQRPAAPMQRSTEPVLPTESARHAQTRTPVFTEHFGDDTEGWRLDESDRRNQDDSDIASRVPEQLSPETMSSLPVFARKTPPNMFVASTFKPPPPPPHGPPPPVPNDPAPPPQVIVPEPPAAEIPRETPSKPVPDTTSKPAPETPAAQTVSRSPSGTSTGLLSPTPARLKSNASSRFSFDLAGVGSVAQEKLLEEKHRQLTASKARESIASEASIVETDDEDGYDDMDMDGYAEDIPGMDSDDDDFPASGNVADFVLPSQTNANSMPPSQGLNNSFSLSQPLQISNDIPQTQVPVEETFSEDVPQKPTIETQSRLNAIEEQITRGHFIGDEDEDDDDLYFDDGMIDDVDLKDGEKFDESVFDDESDTIYGKPLRDQTPIPTLEIGQSDSSQQSTRPMSLASSAQAALNAKATADTSRTSVQPPEHAASNRKPHTLDPIPQASAETSLTQNNLAAYHDALAFAANKAAKEGRFDRKQSMDRSSENDGDGRPRVTFDDCEQVATVMDDDVLGFDFDDMDVLDDDAIIAAANAEVLENDDDGFYGTEFGFFARGDEAEYINGGYFGAGFNDMVKRSYSGRDKDISLTPITERSEWSQRNSMISLAMAGSHHSAVPTPGLAQLADSIQYEDDNMSLSALMKLRRGAFGDSSTSLPSSAGSFKSGSPQTFMFPQPPTLAPAPASQASSGPPRTSSATNLTTMMPPPELPARLQQLPPMAPPTRRPLSKSSHSRTSSGGESVTYTKERDDGATPGRWVMERRRTSEAGEVEILGRQVLDGQRI